MDSTRKVFGDASNVLRPPKGVKRNPFAYLTQSSAKKQRLESTVVTVPANEELAPLPEPTTRDISTFAFSHHLARGGSIRALRTPSSRPAPMPPSSLPSLECLVSSKATDFYHASSLRGRSLSLAYSHDAKRGGRQLVASGTVDGHIGLWDTSRRLAHDPLPVCNMHRPHGNMIRDIHWSTDDTQLLSAGADGFARISQVETQTTTHQFSHSFALHSVSFDPNNESVVCTVGRDKRICIWDMRNSSRTADGFREPVLTISPCSSKSATSITSALYLPHEPQRIVTSWSSNGILKKWDLRYLSSVDELSLPSTLQDPVEESAVDPTTTGAQRPRGISHLVYNERTRLIYSLAVNGRIYAHEPYLEAPSPSTLLSTYGHSGVSGTKDSFYVRMSISSCGRWLASGSSEGQAYVYALDGRPAHPFVQDRAAYQRGVVLNLHQDEVHGLDWAKDTLALASDDQMVSLWRHDEEVGKKCREDSEAQNWNWTWATRE